MHLYDTASKAYYKGSNVLDAAAPHCECEWLIKLDVQSFFEPLVKYLCTVFAKEGAIHFIKKFMESERNSGLSF